MASPILIVFGSGPGIGIAVAKLFAQKHFDRIVLCARNAGRLESEKKEVEEAAKKVGRNVDVTTIPVDMSSRESLQKALKEIEKMGPLGCVYHNAAKINFEEALTTSIDDVEDDFRVSEFKYEFGN